MIVGYLSIAVVLCFYSTSFLRYGPQVVVDMSHTNPGSRHGFEPADYICATQGQHAVQSRVDALVEVVGVVHS